MKTRGKTPTSSMHLLAVSHALAQQRRRVATPRPRSAPAQPVATAIPATAGGGGKASGLRADPAREMLLLQAKLDEVAARAASAHAALVKQSIAGLRRAETLQVTRGVAAARNARRDAKIAELREERFFSETARREAGRWARSSAKDELSYRRAYMSALALDKERLLMAAASGVEARRRPPPRSRR